MIKKMYVSTCHHKRGVDFTLGSLSEASISGLVGAYSSGRPVLSHGYISFWSFEITSVGLLGEMHVETASRGGAKCHEEV